MREDIKERPHRRIAMPDAVQHQLGIMRRQHAADTHHTHKIHEHFEALLAAVLIYYLANFMNFARRKIKCDPRSEPDDLFIRQCILPDRFAFGEDLFEQAHGLEKVESVRLVKKLPV